MFLDFSQKRVKKNRCALRAPGCSFLNKRRKALRCKSDRNLTNTIIRLPSCLSASPFPSPRLASPDLGWLGWPPQHPVASTLIGSNSTFNLCGFAYAAPGAVWAEGGWNMWFLSGMRSIFRWFGDGEGLREHLEMVCRSLDF